MDIGMLIYIYSQYLEMVHSAFRDEFVIFLLEGLKFILKKTLDTEDSLGRFCRVPGFSFLVFGSCQLWIVRPVSSDWTQCNTCVNLRSFTGLVWPRDSTCSFQYDLVDHQSVQFSATRHFCWCTRVCSVLEVMSLQPRVVETKCHYQSRLVNNRFATTLGLISGEQCEVCVVVAKHLDVEVYGKYSLVGGRHSGLDFCRYHSLKLCTNIVV